MKICPRCGSTNVDWIIPQNWSVWECKDCDFTGPIIEGNKKMADEINKEYKVTLKKEKLKKKKLSKNKNEIEEDEEEEKIAKDREFEEDISDEEMDRRLDALDI